jgi:uracil-DNA glycosylase family 4
MTTESDYTRTLQRALAQELESLRRAGVTHLPRVAGTSANVPAVASSPSPPRATAPPALRNAPAAGPKPLAMFAEDQPGQPAMPAEERPAALRIIAQEVVPCTRCPELVANRTQTVFGVGNPCARLCFCGEAPGADEDRKGEPFVGAAGQLLNKIIESGLRLKRSDVYILNVCKCRPPGNRAPTGEEAANCRPFLDRQLDIIRPEFICCLGLTAAQAFLNTTQSMARLRGKFYDYRGSKVLCTYHPAYLLRNPAAKKDVWEDMKLLMREMGLPLPGQ